MLGVIEEYRDVTQRRRLEAELAQAQKLEAIGRLAGGVAHDFNNLMQVVEGYARRSLRDLAENDPRRENLSEVLASTRRATALTRQLLAFGRRQALRPERLRLNHVIRDMMKMLGRLLGEDIAVHLDLDEGVGPVMADRTQIEQVIMNLAVNARDAMPEGGALTVRTARHLPEPGAGGAPRAVIEVRDTGCGMDEETRSRIFEPFFSTKPAGAGTGLGLATVHGIVHQSGGDIRVESRPGEGTTFRILLPLAAAPDDPYGGIAPKAESGPDAAARGGGETILLVEDEAPLRELIRMELEDLGYEVVEAGNVGEALAAVERRGGGIRMLLTDVVLPGVSGPRLYELLAQRLPGLRVLYMSGHSEKHVAQQGALPPDIAFLEKPFTTEALAKANQRVLASAPPDGEPARTSAP